MQQTRMSGTIELTLLYTCELSSTQKACALSVWRNWGGRRGVGEYPLLFSDNHQIQSREIHVTVKLDSDGNGKYVVPHDAALLFEVLAVVHNEDGDVVRARGGFSRMLLSVLLAKCAGEKDGGTATFAVEYFNDWDKQGNRVPCGTLKVVALKLGGKITKCDQIVIAPANVYSFVDTNSDFLAKAITCAVARRIVNYTDDAAAKGKAFVPLRQVLSRVQAPWFNSTAGVTCGPFYWLVPQPSSNNEAYFDEMLGNALRRHNRTAEWFQRTIEAQFVRIKTNPSHYDQEFTECVRIIGDTLCMPSTALPYISDYVDQRKRNLLPANQQSGLPEQDAKSMKPSESWDDAAVRNGGDCEDLARLIHLMFQGMLNGSWKQGSTAAAAQRVLQLYIGAGTLGSVLSPSLGNEHEEHKKPADTGPTIINSPKDVNAEVGAHMFYMLLPRQRFIEQLRRTTTHLPDSVDGEHTQIGWKNLPSCILEGTGRLDPLQMPATAYVVSNNARDKEAVVEREKRRRTAVRHLLENAKVTSVMQMTRSQRQLTPTPNARLSEFYMQPTSLVTLDLMDSTNSLEFMWVTVGDRIPESNAPLATAAAAPSASVSASAADAWSAAESILDDVPGWRPSATEKPHFPSDQLTTHVDAMMHNPFARLGERKRAKSLNDFSSISAKSEMATHADTSIKYGIDFEDILRNPSPAHVGILPTTSLDSVEARIGAETLRQLRPVALPGNFEPLESIFAAEDVSLKALGIDMKAGEAQADVAARELQSWAQFEMGGNTWPSFADAERANYSLVTFFFAKKELRPTKEGSESPIVAAVRNEYGALKRSGFIAHARVSVENPLPRREQVVLQFLCDASKAPKQ